VLPEYACPVALSWPDIARAHAVRGGSGFSHVVRLTGDGFGVSGVSAALVAGVSSAAGVLQQHDETRAGAR